MANYQLEQTGAEVQALLNAVESPDTTPAAGSSNLITSGAVQAAVAGVSAEVTALGQEVEDIRADLYGVRSDTYTISGYHIYVGDYNFKKDVKYTFRIESAYTGTLYLNIRDADGNMIRSSEGYSNFPITFTWTPSQNYLGAYFEMGNAGTAEYTIIVSCPGYDARLDNLDNAVGVKLIDSATISGNGMSKVIYVEAGYVYKVEISSTTSEFSIYLNSAVNDQFIISCPASGGEFFIPVFADGAATPYIRLFKNSGTQISVTYSCYRMKMAEFEPNGHSLINYFKALTNTLTIRWMQGYWTSHTAHNNNASWCNTEIQFNRGRKITITFPTGYYVVRRTAFMWNNVVTDAGVITSGTTFDTSNWGPWIIGIRRTDYSALTPDQAAAALTITQVSGDVYEMPAGLEDTRKMISDAVQSIPTPSMTINPRLGTNEIGRFMHHQNVEAGGNIVIPSQSLFDIAYAKALGFKAIEANVQTCSDGVAVIKHGVSGKLGTGLLFASGSGIDADTLFSAVTSTALRQNVTYNSPLAKYQGHIPTLDEFCAECARLDIIPFLRGANTAQLDIARKYLPDEKIIVEGPASRGDFKGMMTYYGTGTKAAILATCAAKGMPFYFCWSAITTTAEADVADVIQTLHTNGYLIGGAYLNQNDYQRLAGLGLDIDVSTFSNIPPFENGNKLNILGGNDSNLEMTNASYDSTTQTISVQNGGKIAINNAEVGAALSKICVKIRYSGTLDIIFKANDSYANLLAYQSDGANEIVLAVSSQKVGTKIMEIVAQSAVTIYDIKVFASIVF